MGRGEDSVDMCMTSKGYHTVSYVPRVSSRIYPKLCRKIWDRMPVYEVTMDVLALQVSGGLSGTVHYGVWCCTTGVPQKNDITTLLYSSSDNYCHSRYTYYITTDSSTVTVAKCLFSHTSQKAQLRAPLSPLQTAWTGLENKHLAAMPFPLAHYFQLLSLLFTHWLNNNTLRIVFIYTNMEFCW